MVVINGLFLGLWALGIVLTIWGTWLSIRRFSKATHSPTAKPPITILKPIKGIDSGLETNLESFFHLDYPVFQIAFCIAEASDPAVEIVASLLRLYPEVDAKLYIGEEKLGVNPKINTLSRAYREAKYDHVLISDSNVRAPSNYLWEVGQSLNARTGIATAVVAGTASKEIGGALESTYLNTFYARWMNLAAWFGFPAVVGKCMFFKKSVLERVGGLKTFGCYIAEDYMAGQAMQQLGLKVGVMHIPVLQHIGEYSFKAYWQRHIRWGRIRKAQAPIAFFAEPLFFSVVSGFFGAIALNAFFSISLTLVFSTHLLLWSLFDLFLIRRLDKIKLTTLGAWVSREFLAIPLWLHAILGNTVSWRGKRYEIALGGLVEKR